MAWKPGEFVRRARLALLLLAALLMSSQAGAGVHRVHLDSPGVYLTGVAFFTAFPTSEKDGTLAVHFGDLETLSWVPGALPVVDAHVIAINSSGLEIPDLEVKVSLYLGVASLAEFPPEAQIFPGAENLRESLFFQRTFPVKKFVHATLRRVAVSDIHLSDVVEDQVRQGLWPAYLRVEAQIVGKPEAVRAPLDVTTGFLKILPRAMTGNPAPEKPAAEPPAAQPQG